MTKPSAIYSDSCDVLVNTDQPFILVLRLGENLFENIIRCANTINLKAASLSGLGALEDVVVAYYNLHTKTFQQKLFKGTYELISLNGNISLSNNKPNVHIHAALGTEEYNVIGGHIMGAIVSATAEICITPLSGPMHREYKEQFATKIICPG